MKDREEAVCAAYEAGVPTDKILVDFSLNGSLLYGILRRHGVPRKRPRPASERFWEKVDMAGPSECWEWQASRNVRGYGQFAIDGRKRVSAHRFAYQDRCGEIPEGMCVMHSCDNPPCVNPAHLSVGTHTDNMRDAAAKGRLNQHRAA